MVSHEIFETLLKKRGLHEPAAREAYLDPDYSLLADPLLLPDIQKAVTRLSHALEKNQKVVIYGDYDIDGLSATTLLLDAFSQFGLDVTAFIPSRFDDGYGLSSGAIERLAENGAELIVTVDCGSLSFDEVAFANERGVDVIITDHHNIGEKLPDAAAVINPKRTDHNYPFRDFAGVGVAFSLVRAMQQTLPGLDKGQEKWLLDLVALGTICDIVSLTGENRTLAYWGLKVMQKTKRPGLRALLAVAKIDPNNITAKSLGFGLGPRLNASGRLESAQLSLDLLLANKNSDALRLAEQLDAMNVARRAEQNKIFEAAKEQAEKFKNDPVLVLHHSDWSHGIIGIVAAKILEAYRKPTFVLQEMGDETKGSARSFGDFSVGEAIQTGKEHIIKGGGHKMAAGVSLETAKIDDFRVHVNTYYHSLQLTRQEDYLLPTGDILLDEFTSLDESLVQLIAKLEPFGNENPAPVFELTQLTVIDTRRMGERKQHVKLKLRDKHNQYMEFLAFSAPKHYFANPGSLVSVWVTLDINEWQGKRTVEGRLLELALH